MSQDIVFETASGLQKRLRSRELTPREALDALADRIASVDPALGGYLSTDLADARRQAETADVNLPLGGVPIAIKDVISVAGHPCGCASHILDGYTRALRRDRASRACAPPGRSRSAALNMDEFAMGSSDRKSARAVTRNPWDPDARARRFQRRLGGGRGGVRRHLPRWARTPAAPSASRRRCAAWSG